MPCSDSTSSLWIRLDSEERFVSFEFAKITCSSEIKGQTGFSQYLCGKTLDEILKISYLQAIADLRLKEEEAQFILHLEWDALLAGIAHYLGMEREGVDFERCKINSIAHNDIGIEIALVVLPPKELPKILPCNLVARNEANPPKS